MNPFLSRRRWMQAGPGVLALSSLTAVEQQQESAPPSLKLKKDFAPSEKESSDPPVPTPPSERVGFAVVGIGRLSLEQILPAFGECKHARLVALVSGTPDKLKATAAHYGVPEKNLYSYETYDRLRDNPEVQVIYVVLPNSLHREYTVRGAQAGKHILCEKPMATTVGECEEMIAACRGANRKLMIAYRMQYEPYNREIIHMARAAELGALKSFLSENCQAQGDPTQWRLKKAMAGGGSLPDIGLYCLNASRYITGEEPIGVISHSYSTPGDPRFREVEEAVAFTLQFPSGVVASCFTSYGAHKSSRYRVDFAEGWIELDPAYPYQGQRMRVAKKASAQAEEIAERQLEHKNQFALEMDHMAQCVHQNKQPHTPGEEGLQDQRLMAAIYNSAREGKTVKLPPVTAKDAFRGPAPDEQKGS
ncbi:MAG: Gfo/Idh/MocA family oxidoreductase [Acidobacteriaceae bacterium]|nr:Gfo/Idh/MocA family oxidoreductase [Acidobacteriaceae bacterium]